MQVFFKLIFVLFGFLALSVLGVSLWGTSEMGRYEALSPEERRAEDIRNEAQSAAASRALAQRNLREHPDGKHCLTAFSGQHSGLVNHIKERLREPGSFEHVRTAVFPVDKHGEHRLLMSYRARNGFGGMNIEQVRAAVANGDCSFRVEYL